MNKVVYIILLAYCLTPYGSPAAALALGIVYALLIPNPFLKRSKKVSKVLLQASVVLLGFGMNLPTVLRAGKEGMLFAAASILATFVLGSLIARLWKIPAVTATLISAGTAICGGSAIAAVGSVIAAPDGEMSVAIGTIFLLNAVSLYLFPAIGHALHLSEPQFGMWAGIAIHDVSSVVGAASKYGDQALEVATAVKLSRALWIVPISLVIGFLWRKFQLAKNNGASVTMSNSAIQFPWFILLFLIASVIGSYVQLIAQYSPLLSLMAKKGLAITLFLIGSGISPAMLKAVGWKPLAQGVILWVLMSVGSLMVILNSVR